MPHVYLATPITSVPENQRQIIVRWCRWYIQNKLRDKDVFLRLSNTTAALRRAQPKLKQT